MKRAFDADGGTPSFTNEYFVYDGDELALRYGHAQELTHRYLYGPAVDQALVDEVFVAGGGERVSDDVLWLLGDHQNSVRDVVDDNGILRKHIDYDSFGQITAEQFYAKNGSPISATHAEAVDQLLAYTGQERDSATGLQQHGHDPGRWYDPRIGRWLSEDPIGFDAGDPNIYRYVGNGVTYRTDPTGLRQAGNPLDNLSGALGGGYRAGAVQQPKPFNPALTSAKAPTYYSPLPTVNSSPVASTVGGVSSHINQLLNPTPSAKDFARATPLPTYDYYNSLARPTAPTREQLYQAELNPHGRPVSVQTIVSPTYGNIFRSPSAKLQNVIQTTNSPLAAGAAQLVKPIVSIVGHVAGGLVDAALPPSDPRHLVTYSNGARGLYLGEGPTTGGLTGQALLLAPPILSGTSRAAGQLVLRTNGNPSTIAPSSVAVRPYEVGTADVLLTRSVIGDGIDIHHVGQARPFERLIPGYSRSTGPAIALPNELHRAIPPLRGTTNLTPRQVLARDIRNLRNYTDAPNSSLKQLIELNKQSYPGAFGK